MHAPLNRPLFPFFAYLTLAWEKCKQYSFAKIIRMILTAALMSFHDIGFPVLIDGSAGDVV